MALMPPAPSPARQADCQSRPRQGGRRQRGMYGQSVDEVAGHTVVHVCVGAPWVGNKDRGHGLLAARCRLQDLAICQTPLHWGPVCVHAHVRVCGSNIPTILPPADDHVFCVPRPCREHTQAKNTAKGANRQRHVDVRRVRSNSFMHKV